MPDQERRRSEAWINADEGLLLRLNGSKWQARVRRLLWGRRWAVVLVWRDKK